MNRKWQTAVIGLLAAVASCSTIDCPVQNTVYSTYAVYSRSETVDTLRDTLTVITRRADGLDSIVFNRGIGLTAFSLPMSYCNPEDTLCFRFSSPDRVWLDTVWIKKADLPHFESIDCSAAFFHHIDEVSSTHRYIDTVIIHQPTVDYDQQRQNFRIILKGSR